MIAHFADLQLGFNYGPNGKSDERRQDVRRCFNAMINEIVRRQCSTVLLVGDIFHFANPRREELLTLQWGLETLSHELGAEASIIVISGNHDTPKSTSDCHPLRLFESIPKVNCVWEEPMLIETDDCSVYAIPWVWGEPLEDLSEIEADTLAVHAPVLSCLPEAARDAQVRFFDPEANGSNYWYVALGDFHERQIIPGHDSIVFPGSLEHTSFGEAEAVCGGVFVSNGDNGRPILDWWDSPARWMELATLDLTGRDLPGEALEAALTEAAMLHSGQDKTWECNPLIRLTVSGVDPTLVDTGGLAQKFPYVKIKWADSPPPPVLSSFTPGEVDTTWTKFAEQNELPSAVCQLGSEALLVASQQRQ